MPARLQLSRRRGGGIPDGARSVARPTPWGNPWPVGEWGPLDRFAPDAEGATGLFRLMVRDPEMRELVGYPDLDAIRRCLRGRDLACWCGLPRPGAPDHCHAAVLIEVANS